MPAAAYAVPNAKPARIVSIQVCRGLAAVVVVLAHLFNVERKYLPTHLMQPFQYGTLGVDLFFVISGVVISSVTYGKFGSPRVALRFLYHRFARIYPVYWIYTAVVFAAYLYNPLWINASAGHHVEVVRSFLLIPSGVPMLIMQGWTLSYEIYFYLVTFLLLLLVRDPRDRVIPWLLALWAVVIVLFAIATLHRTLSMDPALGTLTNPIILEFLAGCLIFRLYRRSTWHPAAGVALVATAIVLLAAVIADTSLWHGSNEIWFETDLNLRPLFYGLPCALFLFGAMELERTRVIRFARPFALIGDWSYSIYLSHLILIELLARILVRFAPRLPFAILLLDALALPLILAVGYLSYRFLERPLVTLLYRPSPRPVPLRVESA